MNPKTLWSSDQDLFVRRVVRAKRQRGRSAGVCLCVRFAFSRVSLVLQGYRIKPSRALVSVGLTHYCASTPDLSNVVVFNDPSRGNLFQGYLHLEASFPLRCFQRLSLPAFSYLAMRLASQPVYPGDPSTPVLLVPSSRPPQISSAHGRYGDQTVSRRFKPSSRTTLNGEQPYPWDLLQPQDVMSHIEVPNSAVDGTWRNQPVIPRVPFIR